MRSIHLLGERDSVPRRAVTGFVAGIVAGAVVGALAFGARQWVLESEFSGSPEVALVVLAAGLGLVGGAAFGGFLGFGVGLLSSMRRG